MNAANERQPKIVGFLCNWCSYAGSDLAGTSRIHYDTAMRAVRVMCSGRVEPGFVIKAFMQGADGVIIAGCHIPADCHYTNGNLKTLQRYESFQPLLEELGIEKERLQLHWISASEGEKFAVVMNEFSETIKKLGPLNLKKVKSNCPLNNDTPGEFNECPVIRKTQEFAACEAASSGMIDLDARKSWNFKPGKMEPSILYDPNKCIRCGSCVETCKAHGVEALRMDDKEGVILDESRCVRCGQCILSCPLSFPDKTVSHVKNLMDCNMCPFSRPVGAITEQDDTGKVAAALKDPEKYVVVEIAPAVRSTIGEEFGAETGTVMTGKLYAALKKAGFDRVWDTNFTADLTIMEEGTELINRLQGGSTLPQFTSCCPAWVKFVETYYPRLIPNLSTAKSPQQMFGAVAKTYAAERLGVDPGKMFVVSIMPCAAKKFERSREELSDASRYWKEHSRDAGNYADVDAVLTTRECVKLFKQLKINPADMPEVGSDAMLGEYTGAAVIFGRTGGVMTASLRTAYEIITGKGIPDMELSEFGDYKGIKTACVPAGAIDIKVAVVYGLNNARFICEDILKGGEFSRYHFIEVMTCPGGCVGGGGQIISTNTAKAASRAGGLNRDDKDSAARKSHENSEIRTIYGEFLSKPCSELSHHLLHTGYMDRSR